MMMYSDDDDDDELFRFDDVDDDSAATCAWITLYPDWCPSSQLPMEVSLLRCQISEVKQPNSEIAIFL